ncbi:Gibberellin 20-oxidase-like protein [Glycine soja]
MVGHAVFKSPKESKCLNDKLYDQKQSSKSFWNFKRSSSCGTGPRRSFCPLPLLSRSNSTGSSTPSVKRNPLSKEGVNNIKHKHSSTRLPHHSFVPNNYHHHQKPPLNYKTHHGSYGTSVRVNPVLNIPPAKLFGLASIFSNNRDKSKKSVHGWICWVNDYSAPEVIEDQVEGLGMHTDMSCITILYQDEIEGLQVRSNEGEWIDINPSEGTLVVNIGDMLQAWSNDFHAFVMPQVASTTLTTQEQGLSRISELFKHITRGSMA